MTDRLERALRELPAVTPPPLARLLARSRPPHRRARRLLVAAGALLLVSAGLLALARGSTAGAALDPAPIAPDHARLTLAVGQGVAFTQEPFDGELATPAGPLRLTRAQFAAKRIDLTALELTLVAGDARLPSGTALPVGIPLRLTATGIRAGAAEAATGPVAPPSPRTPVPLPPTPAVATAMLHLWAVEALPRVAGAAGALVGVAWRHPDGDGEVLVRTDSQGRATTPVPGDAVGLRVRAAAVADRPWTDGPWQTVLPGMGFEAARPARVLLHRPRTVRGRVLDAHGRPVPLARVQVWSGEVSGVLALDQPPAEATRREFLTDGDGGFVLRDVAGPIVLRARTTEQASLVTVAGTGTTTQDASVDLRLLPTTTVVGQLLLAAGGAAQDGTVTLALPLVLAAGGARAAAQPVAEQRQVRVVADGSFMLTDLPAVAEPLALLATAPGCAPGRAVVRLDRGARARRVALPLRPGVLLRGTLRDAWDAPVPAARVTAFLPDATTPLASADSAGDGSFALPDLHGGRVRLEIAPPAGLAPITLWVRAAEHDHLPLEVSLAPTWPLRGVLVDDAGAPIAGVRVALEPGAPDTPDTRLPERATVSDADGRFAFADLPAGSYRLHVAGRSAPLEVRPGSELLQVRRP